MMICAPAIFLAATKSTWLVDYVFFVVALNRGIRRMVDYNNGYFDKFSLISLTPIIVAGLASLIVLIELNNRGRVGRTATQIIYLYGLAVAGAFAVGLINSRFAAAYALGDYIAPIGLIGFAALYSDRPRVLNRWCNSIAFSCVVVALYGLYQFYTIPPWDAFWVRAVDFEGYLGTLEPGKMTLFSTMSDRGPAATYLCGGLILLLLRPATLGAFRWPSAGIVFVAMLLTYSRTTVIWAGLAFLLFPLINRGAGMLPVAALTVVVAVFGQTLLSKLPGSGRAASRVGTIGNIQEDGSFKGRIQILGGALKDSIKEPMGLGIGSHGLAQRINKSTRSGVGDSTGYVETLRTFGWAGFIVVSMVFYRMWRFSSDLIRAQLGDRNVRLFRAWFLSGLAAAFSGSWMFTATFFWVLGGYCLGRYDLALEEMAEWEEQSVNQYVDLNDYDLGTNLA